MTTPHHFSDPCIHCGRAMANVAVGPCLGDVSKAVPLAYASLGVRWDGVERYRIRMSDGRIEDLHRHVSEHAPYYHFGHSREMVQPPRFDPKLKVI